MNSDQKRAIIDRRITISSLPNEVKRRIVQHVHHSDQNYWHRTSQSGFPAVREHSQGEGEGYSLQSLSLVDKKWRSLCIPYMLEEVIADGCEDDLFPEMIQAYSYHVKRAHFYLPATLPALTALLSALASYAFPNLENVRLDKDAAELLFGHVGARGVSVTAGQKGRWEVFKAVAGSIVDLEANAMSETDLAILLGVFPRLRILTIEDLDKTPSGSGLRKLAKLPLEELSITSADVGDLHILVAWDRFNWTTLQTTLTRIRLNMLVPTSTLGLETFTFVEHFASQLQLLELTFGNVSKAVQKRSDSKTRRVSFPSLREVHLWSQPAQARAVLNLIGSAPIQSASFHYIQPTNSTETSRRYARILYDYLIRHYSSTLRQLSWTLEVSEVDPSPNLGFALSCHIRATCKTLGISINRIGALHDPFLHGSESLTKADDWEKQLESRAEAVAEVIEWGIRRAKGSDLEGDVEGSAEMRASVDGLLASLLEGLKPFKAKMEVERD